MRPAETGRAGWVVLALLMLVSAAQQFHRVSLPAVGDQIMLELSIEPTSMGRLYSVFLYAYTACMLLGGLLADRIGTWWTLLLVVCGSGLFGAATGLPGLIVLAPGAAWWWIAAARTGMGVLSAPLYPSTSATVANWFHPRRQLLANALVIAAAPLGMAASNMVMSALSMRIGWASAFVHVGAATGALALAWALFGRESPGRGRPREQSSPDGLPRRPARAQWLRILGHKGVIALTLGYSAVGYFEYMLFYWVKYYYKNVLRYGEPESALYTSYSQLAMAVTTPLGGIACIWLARHWGLGKGVRILAMGAMTLAALLLAVGVLARDAAGGTILIACLSLSLGAIGASEGPFWTAAALLGGRRGATAGGIVNTGGNLLGCYAPVATPMIAKAVNDAQPDGDGVLGWTAAALVASAVCLAGVLFWLWVDVEKPVAD